MKTNQNITQNDPRQSMTISESYVEGLVRKWRPFLDASKDGEMLPVRGTRLRQNTAVVLENQHQALIREGYIVEAVDNGGNMTTPTFNNYAQRGTGGTTLPQYTMGAGARGGFGVGSHYQTTGQPQHPNDFYAPGDSRVPQTLMPMVRRVFPELLANELFSVQPMSSPVGLIFGLRYKYDSDPLSCLGPNDSYCPAAGSFAAQQNGSAGWWGPDGVEAGYQYLNTQHTGASAGGISGNASFNPFIQEDKGTAALLSYFEFSNRIPGMTLEIEKTSVEAGTRRIATKWSIELEQDLKAMHNLDIDSEMVSGMSYELQAEIDRELLMRAINVCLNSGIGKGYSFWKPQGADGRWLAEKNVVLYAKILREAQLIGVRNRQGAANWLVVTPSVAALLTLLPQFKNFDIDSRIDQVVGQSRLGTLGQFRVYVDTRTEAQFQAGSRGTRFDYVLLGFLGQKQGESGIIFAPYIPAMIQRTNGVNDFSPRLGMITRYGIADNLFGSLNYYHLIVIQDLDRTQGPDGDPTCSATLCGPRFFN